MPRPNPIAGPTPRLSRQTVLMSLDCICDGQAPLCAACCLKTAIALRLDHPKTLSVAMLKRRVPGITGREAALLLEASKLYY